MFQKFKCEHLNIKPIRLNTLINFLMLHFLKQVSSAVQLMHATFYSVDQPVWCGKKWTHWPWNTL